MDDDLSSVYLLIGMIIGLLTVSLAFISFYLFKTRREMAVSLDQLQELGRVVNQSPVVYYTMPRPDAETPVRAKGENDMGMSEGSGAGESKSEPSMTTSTPLEHKRNGKRIT